MCGIAGIYGEANEALVRRMTDRIAHRGPDDFGTKVLSDFGFPASLGHRRLSIIDLSAAGHQPMTNEDGTVWLVFNGEIYNFPALREQLVAAGHLFRSRTDSEVLIHGYEQWGLELLPKLNGIFAFAIWDGPRRRFHLARDRYGVKPLYYSETGSGHKRVLFASEIKSLLCDPAVSRELDPSALLAFAKYRYCPEPMSLFRSVRRVPPGHVISYTPEGVTSASFYRLEFPATPVVRDEAEGVAQMRELLTQTVRRQMISDVPVGLFLSGGVDSAGLLAIASSFNSQPLKTFTIGFRQQDQHYEQQPDDVRYARLMAERCQTDHREIILEPKVVDLLPKVVWHLDDPIADPAAITSYLICQAAREQGTKVLLSGQGGDEVFGGYPWHLGIQLSRYYSRLPGVVRGMVEGVLDSLPAAKGGKWTGTFRRLRKFSGSASLDFEQRLIGFLSYASEETLAGLMNGEFQESIRTGVADRAHLESLRRSLGRDVIHRALQLDMETFLPALNLCYTDKTSMAFGVEVRVPYIDNEVVDYMTGVPVDLKIRGLQRKYLLKKALENTVPREVLYRKKAGFGAPIRSWIVSDLKEMIGDLLSPSSLKRRGIFEPEAVNRVIEENAAGRHDHNYLIYTLLTFEVWAGVFLDGQAS